MYLRSLKTSVVKLFFYVCLVLMTINLHAAEGMPPDTLLPDTLLPDTLPPDTTALENYACVQCHEKINSPLVKDWQSSVHAIVEPVVNCISCHGQLHKDIAGKARRDEICVDCHGGEKNPVVHSYLSSKHGTLMRIEKNTYDWNQSFELANYRAPGCGYCHMHQGNHNVNITVRHDLMKDSETENVHDETRAVCQDCHSPRYITRLFDNGEAMLEIARKKVREADVFIEQAKKTFTDDELATVNKQFEKMQHHLKNVHLGVGHQSPDYQWWHGQPALDGDLLRIKDSISELYRLHK